ncbi:hypothetical protein FBZ96_105685 [Bradyrhizobium stylosanthis]|uniref:Uncharacterized protein n=2 Tax=Bradyrhizobium stylosanthis TaxID=1803665 RepID=A0A560DPH5_9BRAD|nr:hypothetical protein FBZ96_105685 [Bradyrhizobium stylosanthis]
MQGASTRSVDGMMLAIGMTDIPESQVSRLPARVVACHLPPSIAPSLAQNDVGAATA